MSLTAFWTFIIGEATAKSFKTKPMKTLSPHPYRQKYRQNRNRQIKGNQNIGKKRGGETRRYKTQTQTPSLRRCERAQCDCSRNSPQFYKIYSHRHNRTCDSHFVTKTEPSSNPHQRLSTLHHTGVESFLSSEFFKVVKRSTWQVTLPSVCVNHTVKILFWQLAFSFE